MTEAERNSIALFRYGILAPFIQRQVAIANKWSYFNKIAEKQYEYIDGTMKIISPSTLCRWYDAYQKDGFDALKPERRSDLGTQSLHLDGFSAYKVSALVFSSSISQTLPIWPGIPSIRFFKASKNFSLLPLNPSNALEKSFSFSFNISFHASSLNLFSISGISLLIVLL